MIERGSHRKRENGGRSREDVEEEENEDARWKMEDGR